MKLIAIAAAGLVALAGVAPIAATAQTRSVTVHTETRTHTGPEHRTRKVCTVHFRHHQKVRTCRVVRY